MHIIRNCTVTNNACADHAETSRCFGINWATSVWSFPCGSTSGFADKIILMYGAVDASWLRSSKCNLSSVFILFHASFYSFYHFEQRQCMFGSSKHALVYQFIFLIISAKVTMLKLPMILPISMKKSKPLLIQLLTMQRFLRYIKEGEIGESL